MANHLIVTRRGGPSSHQRSLVASLQLSPGNEDSRFYVHIREVTHERKRSTEDID